MVLENLSKTLPDHCQVIIVAGGQSAGARDRKGAVWAGKVGPSDLYRVDARIDRYLLSPLALLQSLLPWTASHFYRSYRDRFYIERAASFCAEQKADCIVFAACPQWAPILREANPEARLVFFERSDWLRVAPQSIEACLACIDVIICPYTSLAERIAQRFPVMKARLQVVYDGVDLEAFKPQKIRPRHRILYVGRISPERGVHQLVEAFRLLRERYTDAELLLVGSVERTEREYLLGTPYGRPHHFVSGRGRYGRRIQDLGRSLRGLLLPGQIEHRELPQIYATSSLMVMPHLVDSASGLALVEAMAVGIPTVATRKGPAPELVQDGRTGLLIEPGRVGEIVAAVEKIFDSRELAGKMGEAARARAEASFSWETITGRCLEAAGIVEKPDCLRMG